MKEIILQLSKILLKFTSFNVPLYRELYARGLGSFAPITGHSPLAVESVLRGMCLSKLSKGKKIQVGRHVLISKGRGSISFDEGVVINHNCYLTADKKGGVIEIGSHSHLDCFSVLHGQGGIVIGSKCAIASGVIIYSQTNQYKFDINMDIIDQPIDFKKVVIEDNVWIGANAVILPGISIGSGSVIGAGAVVNKDVPVNSIAVGVPIRVVSKRKVQREEVASE